MTGNLTLPLPPVNPLPAILAQPMIVTCIDCGTIMHTKLATFPLHYCPLTLKDKLRGHKVIKRTTVS